MTSILHVNERKPPILSNEAILLILMLIKLKGEVLLVFFFSRGKCIFFTNAANTKMIEFWEDTNNCMEAAATQVMCRVDISKKH